MKLKVGDKARFVKDCELTDGKAIPSKSVWIVRSVEEDYYLFEHISEHLVVMIEHKAANDSCEKINTAPSITKRINDKHNILNGLLNSDGSVDGEKLMEKLESNSEEPEKAINLLREMKHNCEHANKYDDPKRHDKAKALGFAIELIEHDYSAVELNMEKLSNQSNDMAKGSHYEKAAMQPLEVMQRIMTTEQFEAFLFGNCLKYLLRKEYKGQRESDEYKARQYAYWLEMVKDGRIINPSKDKVPFDYKFSII
jgi:hypothetical protein